MDDKKKIDEFEKSLLSEKPWTLKGEVTSRKRPKNSLLFENLKSSKDEISPQTPIETEQLENIIKERIKNSQFDDPVRVSKPTSEQQATPAEVKVSQEKSKMGLADLYEKQILPANNKAFETAAAECELKLKALLKKLNAL